MTLKKEEKTKIVKEFKTHTKDSGSPEIQAALFTEKINKLSDHLKTHKKDEHSRRGLLQLVSKRRKQLSYLAKASKERYDAVVKKLGLRK